MAEAQGGTARGRGLRIGVGLALIVAAAAVAGAAQARWHESLEAGLQAAATTHRPVVVFAYISQPGGIYDTAHDYMLHQTLVDQQVVETLGRFEAVRLDIRRPENDAARRRLGISPVRSGATGVIEGERIGIYPVTLFLDEGGREICRRHGYLPAPAYVAELTRAANLIDALAAVGRAPDDAVAHRDLGRAYMEMEFTPGDAFHRAAIENLERAIALDPDDAAGAKYDARVDLTILRLPDDPQQALTDLRALQAEQPEGDRRFELQYYIGVAQYVLGDMSGAIRTLERFEVEDKHSPWWDSPWTPDGLGLLKHLRERQRGG